ncbi:MAG: hypothetical protein LBI12_02480 [Treponema sp.]|jgi:hypothetical protein|nr:hypothetical protein [Treponema sp.]
MKKLIIVFVILTVALPVFAQNRTPSLDDNIYYLNVPVEKVYPSVDGYIVQYRKNSSHTLGTIGLPIEWFTSGAAKAEVFNLPNGLDWPTMSIFYVNGEFSHVRLYLHPVKSHRTWGNLPLGTDVNRFFPSRETLIIEF